VEVAYNYKLPQEHVICTKLVFIRQNPIWKRFKETAELYAIIRMLSVDTHLLLQQIQ